jgi:hypothetical protein
MPHNGAVFVVSQQFRLNRCSTVFADKWSAQGILAVTGGLRTSLSTTVYTAVSSHPVRSLAIRPDRLPVHATTTSPQVVTAHGQILHYTHSIRCRDVAKTCSNE